MSEGTLLRCKVVVREGVATATYRFSDRDVDGVVSLDEDVTDWKDDDIIALTSDLIGCTDDEVEKIEVKRE